MASGDTWQLIKGISVFDQKGGISRGIVRLNEGMSKKIG